MTNKKVLSAILSQINPLLFVTTVLKNKKQKNTYINDNNHTS